MSEPTWAQRKAWNNDGMDPDWRPSGGKSECRGSYLCELEAKKLIASEKEIEALKAENEKLREKLAEAKSIMSGLLRHCVDSHDIDCNYLFGEDEECNCGSQHAVDKAKEFLSKEKV